MNFEILFLVLTWIGVGVLILLNMFAFVYVIFGYKEGDYRPDAINFALHGKGVKGYIEYKTEIIVKSLYNIFVLITIGSVITFAIKFIFQVLPNLKGGYTFIVITLPFMCVIFAIWIWSFRRLCLPIKVPTETTDKDGKVTKTFEIMSPQEQGLVSDCDASTIVHWATLLAVFGIYFIWVWNAAF